MKPLALSLLLLASTPTWAEKTWKINLKDAEISALVTEIADITGKTFVVDPRVKGTVTVVSTRPMSAKELYELFQSVLSINGFAAIANGPVIKILPDTNARQAGVRVDPRDSSGGEQLVTRVVMLQQANANELLAALRPMMPQFAHMASVPGVNALVLSDRASNVSAMEAIIRSLDSGQPDDAIEIIPVRNGNAGDLISVLETMESNVGGVGSTGPGGRPVGKVRLIADARTNRLLVRGDRALRDRVRALIESLDNAPDSSDESVRVFRLKYASARQVAEVLKGILATGDQRVSTSTTSGQSSPSSSNSGSFGGSSSSFGSSSSGTSGLGGSSSLGGSSGFDSGGQRQTVGATTISVGSSSLIADETQNALIVRAKSRQIRQIEAVLGEIDVRRKQVLIQAAILEVSGDNAQQLGIQYAVGDPTAGYGIVNFSNTGASIVNLAAAVASKTYTNTGVGDGAILALGTTSKGANGKTNFYGALIQALNSVTDANLLSTPSIITLDNQEAKIVVGQNVPFITGSTATTSSGLSNPFTTIQRQDVGLTLKVTPTISEGGTVKLDVEQEVSSLVPAVQGINSSDIITNKRSIKTSILSDDGQTIVLGGLVSDDVTRSVSKVPFLGDLPYIGALFRSTSNKRSKKNLLVFLQPTILRDSSSAEAVSKQKYEALRTIDLGLDFDGKLTRYPANIDDVYKGGSERTTPALTEPVTTNQAIESAQAPIVIRPSAQSVPQQTAGESSVRQQPAALVQQAPAQRQPLVQRSTPVSTRAPAPAFQQPAALESPQVYGAEPVQPIVATPIPATEPSYAPPSVAPAAAAKPYSADDQSTASTRSSSAPSTTPSAVPAAALTPAPSRTPSTASASSVSAPAEAFVAKPFVDTVPGTETAAAPDSNTKPSTRASRRSAKRSAKAGAAVPESRAGMRAIQTPSGNVYYVPENQ